MNERKIQEQAQKAYEKVDDPHSLWTIESQGRRLEEMNRTKKDKMAANEALTAQKYFDDRVRAESRENDLKIGSKIVNADLEQMTREAQVQAYKRHEMAKQLREAWTKQQQFKDNEKNVENIF